MSKVSKLDGRTSYLLYLFTVIMEERASSKTFVCVLPHERLSWGTSSSLQACSHPSGSGTSLPSHEYIGGSTLLVLHSDHHSYWKIVQMCAEKMHFYGHACTKSLEAVKELVKLGLYIESLLIIISGSASMKSPETIHRTQSGRKNKE